jgi:hypothetical protein
MTALPIRIQMHATVGEESSIPTQFLPFMVREAAFAVLVSFAVPDVTAELQCPSCDQGWDCEEGEYGGLDEHI